MNGAIINRIPNSTLVEATGYGHYDLIWSDSEGFVNAVADTLLNPGAVDITAAGICPVSFITLGSNACELTATADDDAASSMKSGSRRLSSDDSSSEGSAKGAKCVGSLDMMEL